jgi:hypothetical protein
MLPDQMKWVGHAHNAITTEKHDTQRYSLVLSPTGNRFTQTTIGFAADACRSGSLALIVPSNSGLAEGAAHVSATLLPSALSPFASGVAFWARWPPQETEGIGGD